MILPTLLENFRNKYIIISLKKHIKLYINLIFFSLIEVDLKKNLEKKEKKLNDRHHGIGFLIFHQFCDRHFGLLRPSV